MRSRHDLARSSIVLAAAALLAACTTQSVDPGTTSTNTSTGGAGPVSNVELSYQTTTVTVNVAVLDTEIYQGNEVVPLDVVWAAGQLGPDVSLLEFNFIGDDGYQPSQKPSCVPYVPGDDLPQGYMFPDSRTIVWDSALGLFGCNAVKNVAQMVGLDIAAPSQ